MYVAVNQTIGAGAACVKALTTLYEEAQKQGMAIDGQFTNLNIHWFQQLQYMAQRHRSYRLCEADDIPEFFNHCKNILAYLYGPRHQKITTALNTLFQAIFMGDKHRHKIEKGYDAYTRARHEDVVQKYITDQKAQGMEINGTTSTFSTGDFEISAAES
jgi:hypothetical protein